MAMGDTHYLDTWHAMEKLLKTGKVRAIGLSNFTQKEIQNIIDNSNTVSTNWMESNNCLWVDTDRS